MRTVLLIVNPASRLGVAGEAEAVRAFRAASVVCEVVRTERTGHAGVLALSDAGRSDAVFTLGGDGTAMEVVGALIGSTQPVGILPGGTGNQLARHLGTSHVIRHAVRTLINGVERRMDVGRLDSGRRFALTAGFGMDAAMMRGATPALKRRLGVNAYIWSSTLALLRNKSVGVRATVDGVSFERECGLAMIANVPALLSGLFSTGPGVRADDGLLDLCLFSAKSSLQAFDIVRRCAMKDFRPRENMLFCRGREITIETLSPSEAQVDGELLAPGPLRAVAEPLAARLLAPR
jgi:diacylglycerol kinase family enzyme